MACERSNGAPLRRRHWPEAEKRRMVAEVGVDGQSLSDVGRRHGVHSSVVGRWHAQFGGGPPSSAAPSFVPVTVTTPEATSPAVPEKLGGGRTEGAIEVVLAHGRRLIVAESILPSRLRLLIAAIEAA